jgi:SAM-dependent methyltransferase
VNGILAHALDLASAGSGFRSEFFSELAGLEATNFWFRARNELIVWALRRYKPEAETFLEVGCGTGYVLSGIANACPEIVLTGSEVFSEGLSYAAARVRTAHLMQMDARRVPFVEEFDAIGAFDVLEHIDEDEAVLAQLYRALKPGGALFLTVPQHPWLWSDCDAHACHVRRYTRIDIEGKVRQSGFELVRSTSFVTILLPAMIFSRFWRNGKRDKFDAARELRIHPALNGFFYSLLLLEIAGIRRGMDYPVGGSRFIAARKKGIA